MQIEEVFRLANGRTLFTGVISGHAGAIGICECALLEGQRTRQVVRCEGEPMVKKIDPSNRRRSIATTEAVVLSSDEARSGRWRLVCVG
ncbi:hypothetical protein [Rhodomicrobium vannielii]|uniref:hypothetical protein n=1 Tax=Rhodomicrobium vannielii TaxID=1069 RepID=UPI000B4A5ECA|nr:hypothetical protein [Rhodomicrobium vannielii]